MNEYVLTHTGEELDEAIGKVLDGYILPSGTLSITSNGEKDVKNYEKASVNVPIPDGYIKPSGTLSINSNGEKNVKNYEKASVNVPIKWGNTTVTGNGSNLLTVSGLAFEPLGFIMFPSTGYTWSTNQMICCGHTNSRIGVYKTSGTNATGRSYPESIDPDKSVAPNAGVTGSGTNWSLTIDASKVSFRNGARYMFRYWGL